jgi:hypothetical protein
MTTLRKFWCWLRREHTNGRLFAVNQQTGQTTYVCRDCLTVWSEYESTGRHDE